MGLTLSCFNDFCAAKRYRDEPIDMTILKASDEDLEIYFRRLPGTKKAKLKSIIAKLD